MVFISGFGSVVIGSFKKIPLFNSFYCRQFRPLFKEINHWPKLCLESSRSTCPFADPIPSLKGPSPLKTKRPASPDKPNKKRRSEDLSPELSTTKTLKDSHHDKENIARKGAGRTLQEANSPVLTPARKSLLSTADSRTPKQAPKPSLATPHTKEKEG